MSPSVGLDNQVDPVIQKLPLDDGSSDLTVLIQGKETDKSVCFFKNLFAYKHIYISIANELFLSFS